MVIRKKFFKLFKCNGLLFEDVLFLEGSCVERHRHSHASHSSDPLLSGFEKNQYEIVLAQKVCVCVRVCVCHTKTCKIRYDEYLK